MKKYRYRCVDGTITFDLRPKLPFDKALQYVQIALETNTIRSRKLLVMMLDSQNNPPWLVGKLADVGIASNISDWDNPFKEWDTLTIRDLYDELPKDARRKWDRDRRLVELFNR